MKYQVALKKMLKFCVYGCILWTAMFLLIIVLAYTADLGNGASLTEIMLDTYPEEAKFAGEESASIVLLGCVILGVIGAPINSCAMGGFIWGLKNFSVKWIKWPFKRFCGSRSGVLVVTNDLYTGIFFSWILPIFLGIFLASLGIFLAVPCAYAFIPILIYTTARAVLEYKDVRRKHSKSVAHWGLSFAHWIRYAPDEVLIEKAPKAANPTNSPKKESVRAAMSHAAMGEIYSDEILDQ